LLQHHFSLEYIISKQQIAIKSFISDANNHLNGVFLLFYSLNKEFYLGKWLLNTFSNYFSFHKANQSSDESKTYYFNLLDNIILNTSLDLSTVIIISDASIKDNIAISITHTHSFNSPLNKTLHHTINVMTMEAELFAIRCMINQATQISSTSHIIIVTNTLHVVWRIFDSTIHPYQIQSIMISKDFQKFFNKHSNNSVEF